MDANEEERDRKIEEAFRQALERRKLENGIHEPSAEERMPAKIARKRWINGITNLFVDGTRLIAEANKCSLEEAANLITAAIHKRYLEVVEEEKNHGK